MERTFWQKLEGTTEQVLAQLRKLVEEGNIRRVVVKQKGQDGRRVPADGGSHRRRDRSRRGRDRRAERAHHRLQHRSGKERP